MEELAAQVSVVQLIGWIGSLFLFIATIDKGADILAKWKKKMPEAVQNQQQDDRIAKIDERVSVLEEKAAQFENYLRIDKARLDGLENYSRVIVKALSALLDHALDGNNVESLKDAKKDLSEYLIDNQGGNAQ